ncbi:MAG TPA: hypothetical protein EYQ51_03370 [Alphaproteobacteria bacterium]|nr:hypothetical protein [Alphaproteobacteria bacterium]
MLVFDLVKMPIDNQIKNPVRLSFKLKAASTLVLETENLYISNKIVNLSSLKDFQYYVKIKLFEKDKNLLISLLFRRLIYNTVSGFLFSWLFIFILLNILYLTTSISSNTMSFISLKNVNSFFYFISLLIIILFSQYSIILKKINKCLRIKIE